MVILGQDEQFLYRQGLLEFLQHPNCVPIHPPITVSLRGRDEIVYIETNRIDSLRNIFVKYKHNLILIKFFYQLYDYW